jgi:multidrug efflux system membrane fusion protein
MNARTVALGWLVVLGVTMVTPGCNRNAETMKPPPVDVVIAQPVSEKIVDWDVYTGTVDARESVEVRSRVRGHIKEVRFKEGDEIAAGTVLFVIDSEPFKADLKQAQGQMTTWETKLKAAEEKIAIYKPLAEKGTVAKEELIQALAAKGEAIGGMDTTKGKILDAELNIGYSTITAPIAGKVGEAMLTKGNLVNSSGADSLLTTVVSVDPMYVYFYVNERAYQRYRNLLLQRAEKDPNLAKTKLVIPVEMALAGENRFDYKGIVDFVDNRVDPGTSSIKVRARFDNPKGRDDRRPLTAGLFARVRITLAEPYSGVLVADRAILSDQSLKYVLAVNKLKGNVVERVDVTVSDHVQESGLRAVDAGLKGDEWLIVEGANRARPGVTVNPKDGKMPRRPVAAK